MAESSSGEATADSGRTRRGKNTFVIILCCSTITFVAFWRLVAKYIQGSRAQ
jgi:hypothetical protein